MNSTLQRQRSRDKKQQRNCIIKIFNFPQNCNLQDINYHIYKTLQRAKGLIKPGTPIINSHISQDKPRILTVLFRSIQQTINCLQLNGLLMGKRVLLIKSQSINLHLQEKRPKVNLSQLDIVSFNVEKTYNKLYIGNLPKMEQYQIMNFLSQYGILKSFQVIKDSNSNFTSQGNQNKNDKKNNSQCYCQFKSQKETQDCLQRLNNFLIDGRKIIAKRATFLEQQGGSKTIIKPSSAVNLISSSSSSNLNSKNQVNKKIGFFDSDMDSFYTTFDTVGFFKNLKISCVLLFKNIIPKSIIDNKLILKDLQKQLQKIGTIVKITSKQKNVYIEYQRVQYAQIAYLLIMNRKYDNKAIDIQFYDPIKFADDILI